MKATLAAASIVLTFAVGAADAAAQFKQDVVNTAKKAGHITKEAGKAVGEGTEKAAKTVGEGTEKGAKAVKTAVTGKAHATCVDGTQQTATTEKAAKAGCGRHGGVAK